MHCFDGCEKCCAPSGAPTAVEDASAASSEDCLVLNVFTPSAALREANASAAVAARPVMLYIHGGGFVAGGAPTAWELAEYTGHVVVAIQYRLGVLGFLSTAATESAGPSNFGMLDQLAAMRWVKTNVAAFGGDASKVLIFGCSAGGASVAGHLVNTAANGLYAAAAMESPGGHQGWMQDTRRSDDDWMSARLNLANSAALARALNCTAPSDVKCLQALDLGTLYRASLDSRFAPALAGEQFPLGLIHAGKWSQVSVILFTVTFYANHAHNLTRSP
jgi:para-nitrobenzyl esterase